MALTKNMSFPEMESFLNEELKEQVFLEITPILHTGKAPGGYFGVCRQTLCIVDFLGALYGGYSGTGKISTSSKAVNFIEQVMGEIDTFYKLNGKTMHKMFRHGLVHTYQPKTLVDDKGKTLQWLAYKGGRNKHDMEIGGELFKGVKHLGIVNRPKQVKTYCLCVSIDALHKDLLTAIDLFAMKLENDKQLQANFISTANAIYESDAYDWKEKVGV